MRNVTIGCLALALLGGCQAAPPKPSDNVTINTIPDTVSMPPLPDRTLVRCSAEDGSVIISPAMIPILTTHKDDALAMLEACGKNKP